MDQFATYLGYAVFATTILDAVYETAQSFAAETPGDADDKAVGKVKPYLDLLHRVISHLSAFRGKQ